MKTSTRILSLTALLSCAALYACGPHAVEKDMEEWCTCQQAAKEDPAKSEECIELMQAISVKYEFDPEAVVIIQTKAEECK